MKKDFPRGKKPPERAQKLTYVPFFLCKSVNARPFPFVRKHPASAFVFLFARRRPFSFSPHAPSCAPTPSLPPNRSLRIASSFSKASVLSSPFDPVALRFLPFPAFFCLPQQWHPSCFFEIAPSETSEGESSAPRFLLAGTSVSYFRTFSFLLQSSRFLPAKRHFLRTSRPERLRTAFFAPLPLPDDSASAGAVFPRPTPAIYRRRPPSRRIAPTPADAKCRLPARPACRTTAYFRTRFEPPPGLKLFYHGLQKNLPLRLITMDLFPSRKIPFCKNLPRRMLPGTLPHVSASFPFARENPLSTPFFGSRIGPVRTLCPIPPKNFRINALLY